MTGRSDSRLVRWLLAPVFWDVHDPRPLARAGRHTRAALDTTPAGVVFTDPEGRVAVWNRAAAEHWGVDRREVVGRDVSDVVALLVRDGYEECEHELRSAVAALHGSAETLVRVRERLDAEQEEILYAAIASQIARLRAVLEQLSR